MSEPIANPPRLSSLSDGQDAAGVGRLFRAARELPDEELPRLRWRLRTSQQLRAIWPRRMLKAALIVSIAFFMGGVVGAVVAPRWVRRTFPVASPPPAALAPSARQRTRVLPPTVPGENAPVVNEPIAESAVPALEVRPPEDVPVLSPVLTKRRKVLPPLVAMRGPATVPAGARELPAAAPVAPPPAVVPPPLEPLALKPPPPVTSSIAVEQALLGSAMRTLRTERDARTALVLLAQHHARFPRGVFTAEATALRIEALLVLGRRGEALALLDEAPLPSLPNRDEQLVVRGELRAAHGRWRDAARDFDEALAGRGLPATSAKERTLHERALWGRAAARSRLGDQPGARADLDLYRRYFPDGLFAATAALLSKGAP